VELKAGAISATRRKLAIAGLAGNVLEWYDFSVYGYFAAIIGQHFFPSKNPTASLIAAFGVFGAGFLMRPVGALLFGYVGDNWGRERALTLSVLAMAAPTFLIGLIPDYRQIGAMGSVLMVALRLIQGLSVGGEYTTSIVFLVERGRSHQRGLMGSYGAVGAFAGVMLGSTVGAILTSVFSPQAVDAWAWRLPFLAGITIGISGFLLRRQMRHGAKLPDRPALPLPQMIRAHWRTILRVTGFKALNAVGFYTVFVYATTYLTSILHVRQSEALDINAISLAFVLLVIPAAGMLSDRVGRKPLLLVASLGTMILAWPLFRLMHHPVFGIMLAGQLGFAVLIGLFCGAEPAAAAEAFPAHVRCSGTAISHNLCMAALGGTAPMVATYLIARTHHDMSPAWYLMMAAAISALVTLGLRETANEPLAR
jgi:MFS transporter, MHS family, proline/betaine transporter